MAATKVYAMDLEVMRKEDSSWHPCCISLSSSDPKVGIVVDFGNGDEEDVIYVKEEALSRLRFRSTPLQADECSYIKEGDCVLALQKTQSKSLFLEATIEEPKRVKHSKRVHCRCAFEIKWLKGELKGETLIVPSKSILKFSDRSIDEHPIFSSFLKALCSENGRKSPSVLPFSEEGSCEAEFVGILERQVDEISKLVDGSVASFAYLFMDVKSANAVKQRPSPALVQSKSFRNRASSTKRSTRSQNNNQIETQVSKETDLRPVLSPLAARAALASLVHELREQSYYVPGEEEFPKHKDSQQSDATGITVLSTIDVTSNSVKSTLSLRSQASLSSNPSRNTNEYSRTDDCNPHLTSPHGRNVKGKIKPQGSLNMSANQGKVTEASRDQTPIIHRDSKKSVNREKRKNFTGTRRLTRSMHKESEVTPPAWSANKGVIASSIVIEKEQVSKSSSFELEEEFASDEDDVKEEALSKKSAGSTYGTWCTKPEKQRKTSSSSTDVSPGTGNKAEEQVPPDNYEAKRRELASSHVDSSAERNEPASKRRTGSTREDHPGADMKDEENHKSAKKNHLSLNKPLTAPPLRSSPRFACPSQACSQARN